MKKPTTVKKKEIKKCDECRRSMSVPAYILQSVGHSTFYLCSTTCLLAFVEAEQEAEE